ncbi:MAG: hypothetical protein AAB646_02750 [Patescibacteria group bacterium]
MVLDGENEERDDGQGKDLPEASQFPEYQGDLKSCVTCEKDFLLFEIIHVALPDGCENSLAFCFYDPEIDPGFYEGGCAAEWARRRNYTGEVFQANPMKFVG